MHFKIHGKDTVTSNFLKLDHEDGCVKLHFVDQFGAHVSGGNILKIDSEGTLRLYSCVRPDLGIKTGYNGKIVNSSDTGSSTCDDE